MGETFITKTVAITAEHGLHIRPAEQMARLANQFAARVELIYQDQRVDAKSIMEVLTLGASHGADLTVEACGEDAEQAVVAISAFVASGFAPPSPSEPAADNSSAS